MKCYKCGGFLYENDYCAECGADVSTYKRIVKKSNELYNRGLEMAKDRNLTGAIEALRVSLKMYKANINARNLLGLIYVEIGEYTMGLAQWVISKSQQSDNNMADHFLEELQNSRQELHMMNYANRKYNKAIGYVEQGNYDLAEIQLKKLLNDNSHLVKAYQLLALLLINKKKYAEARNVLNKARRIDQGNAKTIAYITAVEDDIKEEEAELSPTELRNKRVAEKKATDEHNPLSGDDVIIPKSSYREYNPATMAVIQIIIGVIIGAALIFFVVTPAKTKTVRSEYQAQISDLNAKIAQLEQETVAGDTAAGTAEGEAETKTATNTEDKSFSSIVTAQALYASGDVDGAAQALESVDEAALDDTQKAYYTQFRDQVLEEKNTSAIYEALDLYNAEEYTEAKDRLQALYDSGVKTAGVLYYLGRSYDYLDQYDQALAVLQEFVATYPDNENVEVANQIITGITS